ncbi:MAG: Gldg family protein [Cyanobacteria bacterium P01_A01_bin.40]
MTRIIIFLLGIALCVAGTVTLSITATWTAAPILLFISGTFLLILGIWLWGHQHQFWQLRSTKQGIGAITKTIVILIILGLLNWLGIRYNQRWDFSENQLYTLSEQSQVITAKLEQPLEVVIFDRTTNSELDNLLQNYRRYSDQFQYKFVNPEQEIGLAQQFGVQSLGEIYLQYGDKRQKLDTGNLAMGELLTETKLTNGIAKIKRDRPVNIYFLQGHGEASLDLVEGGLAQATKNLEDKGNNVQTLNLASQGAIPDDADLIVIAGATRKLLVAEVTILQQYLQAGGNLLLLLVPNTDIGITPITQNWGIELDQRLIVDGSGSGSVMGFGPAVAIINNYGEHPITASFRNGISLFPEVRPIKVQAKTSITSVPLAISNRQTWAESNLRDEQISFDAAQDIPGPLDVAIALSREQPQPSRIVVFGSATFATNGWFEQQLNGDLVLNSISWLVGEDQDLLTIRPKEPANRRILFSSLQTEIISWLALRIMPLMALVTGVYFWWLRR